MSESSEAIAVVGLSGRFPQAPTAQAFWENLAQGRECITRFSEEELLRAGVRPEVLAHPHYVPATGCIEDIDQFDAEFFGFNPRDAEILDPQHRVFLECAWEALEDGGYDPAQYPGLIGVIAGSSMSTYAFQLYNNPRLAGVVTDFQILVSNDKDHLSTRTAYKCGLRGPAITVGTACSTSLVAICLACEHLLDYQCDLALAGGVTLNIPQRVGYVYQEGGIASPDGHCRSFDTQAKGTVGGNGAAVVLLKRLSEAIRDGDSVRAVILGYGMNNDGARKVGYTAPSVTGQAEAIAMALAMSGVEPDSISMLEAHGTATELGDPIEFSALCQAYQRSRRRTFCALGSVKSNVGHMDSAAGAAGLIKCVLSLQHGQIPPTLHFEHPNPKIDLAASPFFVNTRLRPWPSNGAPRRAGVSSFGIGGTNAHAILQERPELPQSGPGRPYVLLGLSALSTSALDAQVDRLAARLESDPDASLQDVAYTLRVGRREMPCRCACVLPDGPAVDALPNLRERTARRGWMVGQATKPRPVSFLFPGQGAQHAGMSSGLYESEPVFRSCVDECSEILRPLLGLDLRSVMFAPQAGDARSDDRLKQTWLTQPAVFTASYALARLWMAWGLVPTAMLGHSIGEYVAACLAGVFDLESALKLVAHRGHLLESTPAGAMISVGKSAAELDGLVGKDVAIAAINAPALTVLAGSLSAIEELEQRFRVEGISVTRLHTTRSFHSRLVEPAIQPLTTFVTQLQRRPPSIPFVSNVTGTWIRENQAQDPAYWGQHLRATVRFSQGIELLLQNPDAFLLEVGPGTSLTTLTRQHRGRGVEPLVLSSCRHPLDKQSDEQHLISAVARLWVNGAAFRWPDFYRDERRRRLSLPTYPFQRQRYWVDSEPTPSAPAGVSTDLTRLPVDHWFYCRRWVRELAPPPSQADGPEFWLLVGPDLPLVRAVEMVLKNQAQVTVQRIPEQDLGPAGQAGGGPDGLEPLTFGNRLRALSENQSPVRRILWFGSPDPLPDFDFDRAVVERFRRPLQLLQEAVQARASAPLDVTLLTWNGHQVQTHDSVLPEQALPAGLVLTLSQEYPQARCRLIDLNAESHAGGGAGVAEGIVDQVRNLHAASVTALRARQWWMLSYEPAPLVPSPAPRFAGSYLITGGLGRIGLLVAEFLARSGAEKITLLSRRSLQDGKDSSSEGKADANEPWIRQRLQRIRAVENYGATVQVIPCELSDPVQVRAAIEAARNAEGRIEGVFHAAGVTSGDGYPPFSSVTEEHIRLHFAPKVAGTRVLHQLLSGAQPSFVCCFSSICTALGGLGFTPYAAANHYLDAFSACHTSLGDTRWVSIGWDGWALETEAEDELRASGAPVILADEGVDALARILSEGTLDHILVSTSDLGRRLAQWATASERPEPPPGLADSAQHPRPELKSAFVAPAPGLETDLARIWAELLGIEAVGAEDNFFELGGHSLLAIQVISRLRQRLGRDLPVRILFDHPTVSALVAALDADPAAPVAQMREILEEVERLSGTELDALSANPEECPQGASS